VRLLESFESNGKMYELTEGEEIEIKKTLGVVG
jgi:hypothetical protein